MSTPFRPDPYRELIETLDAHALGVAKVDALLEMLRVLFTEDEASIAAHLRPKPEPFLAIAERARMPASVLLPKLESMANKGLLFATRKGPDRYYALQPLWPGIIEFALIALMRGGTSDREKRLAETHERYFAHGGAHQIFQTPTQYARVVPVQRAISDERTILRYEDVSALIGEHKDFAITTCYCRHQTELLERGCGKPKDVCTLYGPFARYLVERGIGRKASADDMRRVLDRCEEVGLVHISDNVQERVNFICNCCGCCCVWLKGITHLKIHDAVRFSRYYTLQDRDACTDCGECVDRCQVGAIHETEQGVTQTTSACIGCGLCLSACTSEALSFLPRETFREPPRDLTELRAEIIKERNWKVVRGSPAAGSAVSPGQPEHLGGEP